MVIKVAYYHLIEGGDSKASWFGEQVLEHVSTKARKRLGYKSSELLRVLSWVALMYGSNDDWNGDSLRLKHAFVSYHIALLLSSFSQAIDQERSGRVPSTSANPLYSKNIGCRII